MSIKVKYLGHSSFIISINGKNILTDPYFSNEKVCNYKRLIGCSEKITTIPKIDVVLISHEHYDSCDIDAANYLVKKYDSKIIAHQSILNKLEKSQRNNLISIDEYQTTLIQDIKYTAHPAHHPTSFYPLSYLLNYKEQNIYFAGDTNLTNEHDNIKADLAFLPIGGRYTMDIGSAVQAVKKMKPKVVIPMQYNTFEDIKVNINQFTEKLSNLRFPINPVILAPGKCFSFK